MENMSIDLFACLSETEKKQSKLRGMIAAAIENKRYELDMSQNTFAKKLGVSQGMVSKLESTEYNMSVDRLIELFEKLNIKYNIDIDGKTCVNNSSPEFQGVKYSSYKYTLKSDLVLHNRTVDTICA